jgi:hypothetical protein
MLSFFRLNRQRLAAAVAVQEALVAVYTPHDTHGTQLVDFYMR